MTSLEELDRPLPIQDMITQVIDTIRPRKEFLRAPDFGGGTTPSRLQESINRADLALNRPRTTIEGLDNFITGSSSQPQSAWDAVAVSSQNDLSHIILMSGKTQTDWQGFSGLSKTEMDGLINQRKNMGDLTAAIDAKYPARPPDAPDTPVNPANPGTTNTTTTDAGAGETVNPLTGKNEQPNNDGKTPAQREQDARDAAAAALKKAETPEGMAEWKKRLGKSALALAVVAGIVAGALANFLASDGAEIGFVSIKTHGAFIQVFPPTDVDVVWKVNKTGRPATIPGAVRVLMGDAIAFHDSTLNKVETHTDGVNPTAVKDKKREFSISTETGDSSDINLANRGWGKIHTNFDAHLGNAAAEAATGFANVARGAGSGFLNGLDMNTIILVFVVIVILSVMIPAISEGMKQG
jgi:hypothetical protein